jgi:hypothetical protein
MTKTTTFQNHGDFSKAKTNGAFAAVRDGVRSFAERQLSVQVKTRVEVIEIMPFDRPDRSNRIGHIIFKVPAELMQVKNWNGQKIDWLDMANYDYNGFNSTRSRLMFGSGYIKLAIREGYDGMPYISWPREKGKVEGQWWDVFKTADVRFGIFHSDNNHNIASALTAFLLTYWGELKRPDTRNRFGFNEHCGNCRNMVYLPVHDGMGHDYENKANAIDTSELTQYGSRMPQWICSVYKDLADEDAVDELNESDSFEIRSYTDRETGQIRWLRPDQILVKGVPVSTYKMRADGTAERCAECPFYHKNERKADKAWQKEVEETISSSGVPIIRDEKTGKLDLKAMGIFVPKYWTERAQANRQPVFTFGLPEYKGTKQDLEAMIERKVASMTAKLLQEGKEVPANIADLARKEVYASNNAQWILGFPGEMGLALEFMVQGLGGIEVHGNGAYEYANEQGQMVYVPALCDSMKQDFIPGVEAFKQEEAQVAKVVNMIHHTCNNFATLDPSALDSLLVMIQNLPTPKDPMKSRFDRAIARLVNTISIHE